MSNLLLAMPARYYIKGLSCAPSVEGVLRMTKEHLVFRPYDPTTYACAEVNECFNQIETTKKNKSKEGINQLKLTHKKGLIFWFAFDTFNERELFRHFADMVIAMQSSVQDTKVSETPAVTIQDVQLTAEEKERPTPLLHENNELLKQHNQFVTDGMLTEAQDGDTRKVSGLHLDESPVKGILDDRKDAITTISTRKSAERTKEENFDADEWEFLEAENEQAKNVF